MNDRSPLEVPPWVFDWLSEPGVDPGLDLDSWTPIDRDQQLRRLRGRDLDLISVRVRDAADGDADTFEQVCHGVYRRLLEELSRREDRRHPVRWWNWIPGILQPLGSYEHRYMAFNAGRYRALFEAEHEDRSLAERPTNGGPRPNPATASGVGHLGRDLVVHCLAADRHGAPVENPRQTPAYRYSERYGPLPPCFARATRLAAGAEAPRRSPETGSAPWLLVGGTASVLGEKSAHVGDLDRQLEETLTNLAAVARAGLGETPRTEPTLGSYRDLRVYFVNPDHRELLRQSLRRSFPEARVEMLRADLCRPDLLVEIEGLARAIPVAPELRPAGRDLVAAGRD